MPLKHLLCPGHMNLGGISPVHCRRRFASVVQEISWFTAKSNADVYCHLQGKVPYWEGGVSSKRKSRVPAASDRHAGSTHEQQWCWVSITGPVCTAGSCCSGGERKPRSLLWLSQGWSWRICHLAPGGAESPVNTPDRVSCKPSSAYWVLGEMNYVSMLFREVKALCLSFVLHFCCNLNQGGAMFTGSLGQCILL